jgi:hypothetical protein
MVEIASKIYAGKRQARETSKAQYLYKAYNASTESSVKQVKERGSQAQTIRRGQGDPENIQARGRQEVGK